jgi:hypothetical protein
MYAYLIFYFIIFLIGISPEEITCTHLAELPAVSHPENFWDFFLFIDIVLYLKISGVLGKDFEKGRGPGGFAPAPYLVRGQGRGLAPARDLPPFPGPNPLFGPN